MVRSLFLTIIYFSFLLPGLAVPFVFTLGYAWVDTFQPQVVALYILTQIPVALIMGSGAIVMYFLADHRSPPRITLPIVVTVLMAGWVTLTMTWAEAPAAGWQKWDWAFKTVLFSAFIPFSIRSRVQIEAFVQIYVLALAANFIPFAAKVMISGGGYGHNLGLENGNSDLAEGGLLSTVCLMSIPLSLFLGKHTQLLPRHFLFRLAYLGLVAAALITALGTVERSALVGLAAMGVYMWMRSRRKLVLGVVLSVVGVVAFSYMMTNLAHRADTAHSAVDDSSALVRLAVWKWTFQYSLSHPLGGGFAAFLINRIELPDGSVEFSRAFHSIYFEVLGEQGWVGLTMFLSLIAWFFWTMRRLAGQTRKIAHLVWCADLSDALQIGMAAFLTSGAFVGIAFQPAFWYFMAMSVSLREYVRRSTQQETRARVWQARQQPLVSEPELQPLAVRPAGTVGWRERAALTQRVR